MLFHHRNIAKGIAQSDNAAHPKDSASHIEKRELGARHFRYTSDKRCKGAQKRHEARRNDSDTAIALIKGVGTVKRRFVKEARVLPLKYLGAKVAPYRIVALVT